MTAPTMSQIAESAALEYDTDVLLGISEATEAMLQEAHDTEFIYNAPRRVWVEACATCDNKPMWGCKIFGCNPAESCFIICPSCGKRGFESAIEGWVPDWETAALLLEKMGK